MKRFYHLILSGMLLCLAAGLSAQPIALALTNGNGAVGEQVCIDLTGQNWDNISGFSCSLIFDPAVLQYEDDATTGTIAGTGVQFNVNASTPNAIRTVWNLFFATQGYTDAGPFTIGTICFTVLQETETMVTIESMPVPINFTQPDNTEITDFTVSPGTINGGSGGATCSDGIQNGQETGVDCGGPDCAACPPTCTDGVQNGNETGVDCGGPDCAPCATCSDGVQNGQETGVDCGGPDCAACPGGGGPDLSCGMGTDNVVLCLGDACDIAANQPFCLDITAGNFTNITAFQADISFESGQLFYQSITTSDQLSNSIAVTVQNASTIRLLFFEPGQAGNTVADGTIIATLCFTNQTTEATNLGFSNMTARDNNNTNLPIQGNGGTVNDCEGTTPTCSDGIQNGQETGVDCGGPDCAACPSTCNDGIMNGSETGVDCGGPDCAPCGTTGGPDLDCGDGTTNMVLCLGDACDIPVNGTACLDITAGNLTNITAFQADIVTNASQLTFLSWTDAGALSNPIVANTSTGVPRLLFFQADQSGNTVTDGTILGTVCFTNLTANASVASLTNLTARDNNGAAVSISGSMGSVNDCSVAMPTCSDGIMNGQETGIDCGGPDCAPCGTNGGPDLNCGMGTDDLSFCWGDACDIPVNGTACVDLTVGNFTNVTAFQADIVFNTGQLTFLSWTGAGALGGVPVNVNTANGNTRLLFFQPSQAGVTVPDGTIIGTACFTNLTTGVSTIDLSNISGRDNNNTVLPTTSGIGTVNDCAPTEPTCTDGIMNGSETGVDCGGPDCSPCGTNGGPDLNCGMGTDDLSFCWGDACDIPVNGTACVDLTVGNFTNVTAFQADIVFNTGQLTFLSWTDAGALSGVLVNVNTANGNTRLLFFQPSQAGVTVPNGTIIGTACFTNLTTGVSTIDLSNISGRDNNNAVLPTTSGIGTVNDCAPTGPTCTDGMMNGSETGVDCGGPDCAPCATCSDGVMNGSETGVDCGGPDCIPCTTVCGEGTTDVSVCLGNECADAGAMVCLPVFMGNFNELGGFQFELAYAAGNLSYVETNLSTQLGPQLTVGNPSAGRLTFAWNDISLVGQTFPNDIPVMEVCFTATNTNATPITFLNPGATLRAFDVFGQSLPIQGSNGSINGNGCGDDEPTCTDGMMNGNETGVDCGGPDCAPCTTCDDGIMNGQETGVDCGGPDCDACPPDPTCDDGIMNGQETGVDCGGPDCPDCDTGGGPDTDCGMGTTDLTLCLGDVCNVGPNGEACVALTVGNFTGITAFQADVIFNSSELTFVSWTNAGTLNGVPVVASTANPAVPRLLFFQPDQSGVTVDNGTIVGELCFTNLNGANTSEINLGNLTARDNTGAAVAISGSNGFVNNCTTGGPDPLEVNIPNATVNVDDEFCLDVTVDNYTDIASFMLSLAYNASNLQLVSITTNDQLPGFGSDDITTSAGQIDVNYTAVSPASLASNAVLFTVCFRALAPGAVPVRLLSGSATNGDGALSVNGNDGLVTINDNNTGDGLTLSVGSGTGGVGSQVCVPVTTNNFDDIVGFQFALTYNSERLQFVSATPTDALVGMQVIGSNPGEVRALWSDFGANPNDLPDGTVLYDVCFTVLQACQSPLVIEDITGFPVRFTDGNNQTVAMVETNDGAINNGIPCDVMPPSNLVLDLGDASGGVGQEVCLDLTVDNFTALTDLTFSVTYDPTIVSFSGANNFGLGSVTAANVNGTTSGVITFDWDAAGSTGETLADGSVLLSLCFNINVLAATNVSFATSPVIISARNANGQNVGVIPSGGRINPNVPNIDGMTFDVCDATGMVGDVVCMPVKVYDPSPITGFQFTIDYDPTVLEFVPGNNMFIFPGFLSINPNTPGVLRTLWDEPTATPQTAANGATLFQVCFRILTDDPTVVGFDRSNDAPTPFEVSLGLNEVTVTTLPGQVNGGGAPTVTSADINNPSCFGDADGSINLTVTGGGNLTYDWTPNVSSSSVAIGLAAGTYSVVITNTETGQSTTETYTLSTLPFQVNVVDTDGVSCNGAGDGRIEIQTVGGASPFLIDWSGSLQDGRLVQDALDSGSYSVTVTDNNGCSMSQVNINIGEPDELVVSGTPINIGDNPGGVNIVVEGGTPGNNPEYTYAWTGPNGYTSTAKDIDDATEAGTYCVTVTDLNGCTDQQCFAIAAAISVGIVIDPGCFEEDNGSIDISPTGGNGTYSYIWSFGGTTFATTQDIDNRPPGDHTVMITSGGQTITQTIEIPPPTQIAANPMVTNATSGSNGAITLTPTGGNPGYTFAWADGPTTQNRTGLASGEYCVTITDASDCTFEGCFTVSAADVTFTSTSTRPASCSDGEDGVIRLVINGGAQPFTVRVEPLGQVEMFSTQEIEVMVPPGTYDVFVTDAQGGQLMTAETVEAPSAISATTTLTSDTEDTGCSGMISLDITGGTAGYTVNWSSGQSGSTISMLCMDGYVATITDANGCEFVTDTFRVGRVETDLVGIGEVSCQGGTDGTIDVTVSGGTEPYMFAWTRAGSTEVIATTEDLTGATDGDYQLRITDATGTVLRKNYTIGIAAGFAVTTMITSDFTGFDVSCDDSSDGTAVAVISGQGEFTYEWFSGETAVDTDSILNDVAAGTYTLLVTSTGGCEIERTVELTAPPAVELISQVSNVTCGGNNDGAIMITPEGGVGGYQFEWSNGSTAGQLTGLSQGTYGLTVTDDNGCIAEASYDIAAPEDLAITFEATPATEGCNGSIQVIPLGGNGPYVFSWPQLPNQGNSAFAEGLCPGEYTIEVTDRDRCQTVTMIARVEDRRFPCLSAREVITPNGDGLNEAFILFCSDDETVSDNSLEIYNRWGQLVYNTTDYDCSADDGVNCFEGRTNDGTELPEGPYYYIFNYTNEFMEQRQQRGSLTIVRD